MLCIAMKLCISSRCALLMPTKQKTGYRTFSSVCFVGISSLLPKPWPVLSTPWHAIASQTISVVVASSKNTSTISKKAILSRTWSLSSLLPKSWNAWSAHWPDCQRPVDKSIDCTSTTDLRSAI